MAVIPLSVQLYTLRDLVGKDFAGTVKEVGKMGYAGVELAGFGNLKTPQEVRAAVTEAGVKISGAHVGLDALENDLGKVIAEQEILGNKELIIPMLHGPRRPDAQGWRKSAELINKISGELTPRGYTLSYHNHDFEFKDIDGQTGIEYLWAGTDAELVKSELDVFWVKFAGLDPVTVMNQLGSRLHLLHLKDMAEGPERRFAEVGSGILDFRAIIEAGKKLGVKWYIVEQDTCYGASPLEAVRTSFNNLKKLGYA